MSQKPFTDSPFSRSGEWSEVSTVSSSSSPLSKISVILTQLEDVNLDLVPSFFNRKKLFPFFRVNIKLFSRPPLANFNFALKLFNVFAPEWWQRSAFLQYAKNAWTENSWKGWAVALVQRSREETILWMFWVRILAPGTTWIKFYTNLQLQSRIKEYFYF